MKTANKRFGRLQKVLAPLFLFLLFFLPTFALAANPTLVWNTFMGSTDSDTCRAGVAVDDSGNVYVIGHSAATWGVPLNPHTGGLNIFIAKYDSSGVLEWNTFMGTAVSSGRAYGIALDDAGNVYVMGESGATWGNPINPYSDATDAVVVKLDSNGVLQWNTFLGGTDQDYGYGIAVGSSGNVYVTGYSYYSWEILSTRIQHWQIGTHM